MGYRLKSFLRSNYVKFLDNNNSTKGSWVIIPGIIGLEGVPRITVVNDNNDYKKIISDENLFNMILSKVRSCSNCGNKKKCAPGINVNFWGKELKNRCKFIALPFLDPNPQELECVKILMNIYGNSK